MSRIAGGRRFRPCDFDGEDGAEVRVDKELEGIIGEESSLCRLYGRGLSSSMIADDGEEGAGKYVARWFRGSKHRWRDMSDGNDTGRNALREVTGRVEVSAVTARCDSR